MSAPAARPRIIVEPGGRGYTVSVRPIAAYPQLNRSFYQAGDALDFAELAAGEIGGTVIDPTGVRP